MGVHTRRILTLEQLDILIPNSCAKVFGIVPAAFLQQLHYWLTCPKQTVGTVHEGKRWIYNRYDDWVQQLGITSERTLRRYIKKLEDLDIVLSANLNNKKSDRTKWYTINYTKLETFFQKSCIVKPLEKKLASPSGQNGRNIYMNQKNTSRTYTDAKAHATEPINTAVCTKSKQTSIIEDMLEVWNEWVEGGKQSIQLTTKRAAFLRKAFTDKFNSSLDEWKNYCKKIASSSFLMGKVKSTFKASLDWALKFDVIQRIIEGDFGVRDVREVCKVDSKELEKQIHEIPESTRAKRLRIGILENLGESLYRSWFEPISIQDAQDKFVISTKSTFVKDWIQTNFLSNVEEIANKILSKRGLVSSGVELVCLQEVG